MQRLPPDLVEALASQIGDLFPFRVMAVLLFQSTGENNINGIANESWPLRRTADAVLREVENKGNTKAFLSLVLARWPANVSLRATITRAIPDLSTIETKISESVVYVVDVLDHLKIDVRTPESRDTLKRFINGVNVLTAYKYLHDCLHRLQIRRFRELSTAAEAMETDPGQIEMLRDFQYLVSNCVTDARPWAEKLPDNEYLCTIELAWIDKLAFVEAKLRSGLDDRDGEMTMEALTVVGRILEAEPRRLNTLIFIRANRLPIKQLIELLGKDEALNPQTQTMVARAGDELRKINTTLLRRVVDHKLWQDADDGLWSLDRVFTNPGGKVFQRFSMEWTSSKSKVRQLTDAAHEIEWVSGLIRYSDLVDDELTRAESQVGDDGRARNPKAVRDGLFLRYNDFRHEARFMFFRVDSLLRQDCTEIIAIGRPLQSILDATVNE